MGSLGWMAVFVGPSFEKPLAEKSDGVDGTNVALEVKVKGIPMPELAWFKDGKPVKRPAEREEEDVEYENPEPGVHRLILPKAFEKDAGKYSAKATNKCGKAETATTLSIGIPPKIKKSYKDAVSKEGEDVSLDLEVSGVPTPQVQWYHHDKLIDSDDKYKVENNVGSKFKHRLTISKSNSKDDGIIKVLVQNKHGEKTHQAKIGCNKAPKIVQPTQDGGAGLGKAHTFHAVVDGMPTPSVQWVKDGKEIFDKAGKYTTKVDGMNYYLTIENMEPKDLGSYTCKAVNSLGEDECKAQVKEANPPSFIVPIKDMNVAAGENVTFACQVNGAPLPELAWFINGKKMVAEPGKVKIEDLGNGKHQITLQNVTAGDAGVISCIAKNEAGEAKCEAQIAIEGADAYKVDGDVIIPETATQQQSTRRKSSTARKVSWGYKGQGFPPNPEGYGSGRRSPGGSWHNPDGSWQRADGALFAPDGSTLKDPPPLPKFYEMGIAEPLSGRRSPGGTYVNPDGSRQSPGGKCYDPNGKLLDGIPPGFFEFGVTIPTGCRSPSGFWYNPDGSCQSPGGNCYDPHGNQLDPVPDGFFDVGVCLPKGVVTPNGTRKNPDGSCKSPNGTCYDPYGKKLDHEPEDFLKYGLSTPGTTQYLNLVAQALSDFRVKGTIPTILQM